MTPEEIEQLEARLIRKVYTPGYAHAENLLVRLRELETCGRDHDEVVQTLAEEFLDDAPGI